MNSGRYTGERYTCVIVRLSGCQSNVPVLGFLWRKIVTILVTSVSDMNRSEINCGEMKGNAMKVNAVKLFANSILRLVSGPAGRLPGLAMLGLVSLVLVESTFLLEVANAQVVVVGRAGGVRVRAPFVSVDVLPFHRGTRLQVPFAAIETGFYRSYRSFPPVGGMFPLPVPYPYAVVPVPAYPVLAVPAHPGFVYPETYGYEYPGVIYPTKGVVGQSIYDGAYASSRPRLMLPLPERLRSAAEKLARTLSLREDGDVWLNYLGPQRIIENVDYGRPAFELQDLVINYDGVVSNGTLRSIQYARGFSESRDLLRQYLNTESSGEQSSVEPSGTRSPVQAPAVPVESVPTPPSPQLPVIKPLAEIPTDSTGQLPVSKMPVSEIGVRARLVPKVSRSPRSNDSPASSGKIVKSTSL